MNEIDKIKLLLVDDEEDFLDSAVSALRRRNIYTTTAKEGSEALEKIEANEYDAAVVDVKMPGMDGVTLFRKIVKIAPELPVIILTGHGAVPQAFETSKEGVFDYLTKPCDMDFLAKKIREASKSKKLKKKLNGDIKEVDEAADFTILLVDDEKDLLHSLSSVLSRRGFKVDTADNGFNALEKLKSVLVDVVVLDIKMAGMDGIEVLKNIKSRQPNPEVILLTGHPDVSNALAGVKLGAFDYVTKPPDIDKLIESVISAGRKHREELELKRQAAVKDIMDRYPDL
ncbi:response regulator [bacterium]|nr:response regulator [bacterium]